MFARWGRAAGALMVVWLVPGCILVGPNYEKPEVALNEAYNFKDVRLEGAPADPRDWWKSFNDPGLDKLIEAVFADNLSLQGAALRLVQARLGRLRSTELLFPAGTLSGGGGQSWFSTNVKPNVEVTAPQFSVKRGDVNVTRRFPNLPIPLPSISATPPEVSLTPPDVDITRQIDLFTAGFDALWEPDIWGSVRRRIQSKSAAADAAEADYDDLMVMLAAEAAFTYVRLRTAEEKLARTLEHLTFLNKVAEAAEAKRKAGADTGDIDAPLAKALAAERATYVSVLEAEIKQAENDLCVLTGKPSYDIRSIIGASAPIPQSPSEVNLGIPADLLRRRPDVRRAEREVASASADIGVAVGELMPKLRLLGTLGFSSSDAATWFAGNSFTPGWMLGVKWNILLYPFIIQNVRIQDARLEEQTLRYRDSANNAAREVENSVVAYLRTLDQLPKQAEAAKNAREAFDKSVASYSAGKATFPLVVQAVGSTVDYEYRLVEMRGDAVLRRIAVYKALGGGWEVRTGRELIPEAILDRMRNRTEWWSFWGPGLLSTKESTLQAEPAK